MSKDQRHLDKRLDELQDMIDENRVYIKKIHKRLVWSQAFRMFYWVVIIGLGVLGYYAAQPYLQQLESTYDGIRGSVGTVGDFIGGRDGNSDTSTN